MPYPARKGGLRIFNPAIQAESEHNASLLVTAPLRRLILSSEGTNSLSVLNDQLAAKVKINKRRHQRFAAVANNLKAELFPAFKRALVLAEEKVLLVD